MTMTLPTETERAALAKTRGLGAVQRQYAVTGIEVRSADNADDVKNFYGHASVTGRAYPMYGGPDKGGWDETIKTGAFTQTLAAKPDVAFLLNHGGMTLARTKSGTMSLAEDSVGLEVKAALDTRMSIANDVVLAMGRGDLDEMSFAFRVKADEWRNAEGEVVPWYDMSGITRDINEVSIDHGDVSVVNFGANPFTDAALRGVDVRAFVNGLAELRAGSDLSSVSLTTLHQVLDLISSADDDLDDAQEVLAALMGVPNPDTPEPDDESMEAEAEKLANATRAYYADLQQLHARRNAAA